MTDLVKESDLGIKGLINFDSTDLPMPFVKLVQPVSQKVELSDGSDAKPGSFYFSVLKRAKDELDLIVLSAKKDQVQWEGDEEPRTVYRVIAIEKGKMEPFTMTISGTSMWEWRNLMGLMIAVKAGNIWDYHIKLTSEKREGDKGKWHIMQFKLGKELTDKEKETATAVLSKFTVPDPDEIDLDDVAL